MKVLITGGTGFVGGHLIRHLQDQGHSLIITGTRPDGPQRARPGLTYVQADTTQPGDWQKAVGDAGLIVNLAGKSIFHRWSRRYKRQLYDSRILTTRNLVAAIPENSRQTLISTSAVGFYGNGGESILKEDSPAGSDFLADLARDWEAEAGAAARKGTRVVIVRFGIILGKDGGALPAMRSAAKTFMGGHMGSGMQWVSWIHIQDLVAAIDHLATHRELSGPFNLCAPEPMRNKEMAGLIGEAIGHPAQVPVPAMAVKMIMGELADVLLASQRVSPDRLLSAGFTFRHPRLPEALTDILG